MGRIKHHTGRNKSTPWKVITKHRGTRRLHFHIIYISTAKNWGFNSKLGQAIRAGQYKCSAIACIRCLLEYITSGDDRTTLRQVLTSNDEKIAKCATHAFRGGADRSIDGANAGAERGDLISRIQGAASTNTERRMVTSPTGTNESLRSEGSQHVIGEQGNNAVGVESFGLSRRESNNTARNTFVNRQNQQLVLFLLENQAFSEGEAQKLLCETPEGITIQFNRHFVERLGTALSISKTLVFSESAQQRIERTKTVQLKRDPEANTISTIKTGSENLAHLLQENNINPFEFAQYTRWHFHKMTQKKNNLFFKGPPSTGKTMVMESLVEMQFNYERLTGLTPNSPFNFSALVHKNACFMDECKLTDNQFEQWKLLAGGQPMSTDIKYKSRHDIKDCVLYTASNYPITMYTSVMEADEAVNTRTIQFNFYKHLPERFKLNAFIWEHFWKEYMYPEENDDLNYPRVM